MLFTLFKTIKIIYVLIKILLHCCRNNQDKFVKNLTRDNVQLLINAIWELPTERIEEAIVAKLPKPKYLLPRSRVVPKPKALTKWQQFAKEKGIRSKKKGKAKLKWDDELKVSNMSDSP